MIQRGTRETGAAVVEHSLLWFRHFPVFSLSPTTLLLPLGRTPADRHDWWGKHKITIGEKVPEELKAQVDSFRGEEQYSALLASSTFCFALPGDGWSARLEDAVLHGWVGEGGPGRASRLLNLAVGMGGGGGQGDAPPAGGFRRPLALPRCQAMRRGTPVVAARGELQLPLAAASPPHRVRPSACPSAPRAGRCIPVIIQDGVHMAFEDILDYPAFSLRIAQADMEKVRCLPCCLAVAAPRCGTTSLRPLPRCCPKAHRRRSLGWRGNERKYRNDAAHHAASLPAACQVRHRPFPSVASTPCLRHLLRTFFPRPPGPTGTGGTAGRQP